MQAKICNIIGTIGTLGIPTISGNNTGRTLADWDYIFGDYFFKKIVVLGQPTLCNNRHKVSLLLFYYIYGGRK